MDDTLDINTKDFFISYTHTDQENADWIDWQLRNAGYSTILQSQDFRPGSNFVVEMDIATRQARRTLLVLSPDYLAALYVQPEWAAAFGKDPAGRQRAILPVRVRNCKPTGLLAQIVYIDLVGLEEEAAQKTLLAGIAPLGERPSSPPPFPAGKAHAPKEIHLNNEMEEKSLSAVILTALPVEYAAVRAHLADLHEVVHTNGTVYESGKFFFADQRFWNVGIVEIGAGNPGAAAATERAIQQFKPSVVFFVGIAGGLKDVALGDVVVSTKVYAYESGKAEEIFKPRPNLFHSTHSLEQRARAEARKADWLKRIQGGQPVPPPRSLIGPIAAGEKVVASRKSALVQFLKDQYGDTLAVEMEGYGFLEAAHTNRGIESLVVRGISDLVDKKAKADAGGSQERAAVHASAFAFEILAKIAKV